MSDPSPEWLFAIAGFARWFIEADDALRDHTEENDDHINLYSRWTDAIAALRAALQMYSRFEDPLPAGIDEYRRKARESAEFWKEQADERAAERDELRAEKDHLVEVNAALRSRPDLAERAPRVVALVEERDRLRAANDNAFIALQALMADEAFSAASRIIVDSVIDRLREALDREEVTDE